jgi:hypothetical protein
VQGTVYSINVARGIVAIETEKGDFSVFENPGFREFETGDNVSWQNDTAIWVIVRNHTKGFEAVVCFLNHRLVAHQLRQQMHS